MASSSRPAAAPQPATFATVADGVRAQVITRHILPPHLTASAHEGRGASCPCVPLLAQLATSQQWPVVPHGAREACTGGEHALTPLRVATWPHAPLALQRQAHRGRVDLTLTMCAFCGAVEVRDVSFHAPAGLQLGHLQPRRRSDVLGWYAGKRPLGRTYI